MVTERKLGSCAEDRHEMCSGSLLSDMEGCVLCTCSCHGGDDDADTTPEANMCSEIPCAEYRDRLECRVSTLEAKVRDQARALQGAYNSHLRAGCYTKEIGASEAEDCSCLVWRIVRDTLSKTAKKR